MLQHFYFKPMYENTELPGWTFSFYFKNKKYTGDYLPNGQIKWTAGTPENEADLIKMIHELMTFHVYD